MNNIFAQIFAYIDGSLISAILAGADRLAQAVSGPLRLALVIYVAFYAFAIMRGMIQQLLMDVAMRVLKLCVLVTLVTESSVFQQWAVQTLYTDIPSSIQQALLGSTGGTYRGDTFDQLWSYGMRIAGDIFDNAGWTDFGLRAMAIVLMIATTITCVIGAVVMVIAKIALALVVSLGPLFIGLALFDATRRWTEAWLSQAVNYIVLMVLIVGLSVLVANMVQQIASRAQGNQAAQIVMMLAGVSTIYAFAAIVFSQLPSIASGLAGGGAALSSGITSATRMAVGYGTRTLGRGGSPVGSRVNIRRV